MFCCQNKKIKNKFFFILPLLLIFGLGGFWYFKSSTFHPIYEIGQEIDSFNGVPVYYNGGVSNVSGRNLSSDGYNYGLEWQCVEFVKRYYYDNLNHKMPNSYGNALNFFNPNIPDGQMNNDRDLHQFTNPSLTKPKVNDLLIFDKTQFNPYGHVAIVTEVSENKIEIVQQNAGVYAPSREIFSLIKEGNNWKIKNSKILGWLRKQ